MLIWFKNLFRKKKHLVFRPDIACSGSGRAISEFVAFQENIEKATDKKPIMVDCINFLGFERVIYILEDKTDEQ